MNSKLKYAVIFLIIFPFLNILGDRTSIKPNSREPDAYLTDFDPNSTMITFYGDSLGDFVDYPLYGYFGWEWYLSMHDTSVRWDIQNLAVASNRTQQVYDLIKDCSADTARRKNFRTADRVALEIGGNDYLSNLHILYYMPWKFSDVDQRVTWNTRVIVRALRNSLRNKEILVMGNFPVLSKSPILGEISDYFIPYRFNPNGQIINKNQEFKESLIHNQLAEDLKASLNEIVPKTVRNQLGGYRYIHLCKVFFNYFFIGYIIG